MRKTFILAGASSAMAQATAAQLRQHGHRVTGLSRQDLHTGYDSTFKVHAYHTGNLPAVEGPVDGLVYFPGTIQLKPFGRLKPEDVEHDYTVNVKGAVAFIQHYLPALKQSPSASVVLMSSVAARTGLAFHSSISMAKAAIEGLTLALAAELAPGIRVNAVAPSLTQSPLAAGLVSTPEKTAAAQQRNPMKKLGQPHEVADAVCFLLLNGWVTGQVLAVDGGMNHLKP